MIPKNIKKEDIIKAIEYVEYNGVPRNRESTKYNVIHNDKLYPPKYLISIANKYVNGIELKPEEFSGGNESNEFLSNLGFEIKRYAGSEVEKITESKLLIGTCCVESYKRINNSKRLELIIQLIDSLYDKLDLLLLPAGFFEVKNKPDNIEDLYVNEIQNELSILDSNMVVCYGVDGRKKVDQLGVAVNKDKLLGMGRKFYHTEDNYNFVDLAKDYVTKEIGLDRIIKIGNSKFYIAVCYDGFGIRKKKLNNPGVDAILNLVHGFNPAGEGDSGDVYFARHSFAGSSKQWQCPTFGAAIFERRKVPQNWPTGVLWNQGEKSTQKWGYAENPIAPIEKIRITGKHEEALIRIFSL